MEAKQRQEYEQLMENYVLSRIDGVLKEPRSFIRYPFIDPGTVYEGNVWDWDTYWSVYSLFNLMDKLPREKQERIIEHAKGNVRNFFDHQLPDGYIPMMIEVQDYPEPYLNMRHKEGVMMNMHKPFLCQQIVLISDYISDYSWAEEFLAGIDRYFGCYDRNYYNDNCGLYVWCDDIMIGVDNDPTTFGRPKFSTAGIYLNTFMLEELDAAIRIYETFGRKEQAEAFAGKKEALTAAILRECWDPKDAFFYSVDVDIKTRTYDWFHQGLGVFWKTLPIKIQVWSGFLPMDAGITNEAQNASLVAHLNNEKTFACPGGVASLAKDEKMFSCAASNNPSNWLGGIWIIANYLVFRGLMRNGYKREAEDLYERTLTLLGDDVSKTGTMHEYYDSISSEPVMNGEFLNWNMLVLNMKRDLERNK